MTNEYENRTRLDENGAALIEKLYDDHSIELLRFINSSLHYPNHMLAEDILHETFYEAIRKLGDLVNHPNQIGWLKEVVKFKIWSYYRRAGSQSVDIEECESELARIEEQYGLKELNLLLDTVFDNHERQLFNMYFIEGYSVKELAAIENITESNFKVRMHRLRKKLLEKAGFI